LSAARCVRARRGGQIVLAPPGNSCRVVSPNALPGLALSIAGNRPPPQADVECGGLPPLSAAPVEL